MGLGFLDDLFCEDNFMFLIIIGALVVLLLLSNNDDRCDDDCDNKHGHGFNIGNFNLGENWWLIVIVLLVVFGDGLDIF